MVIKFDKVTYKENIRTPLEKTYLREVSFGIKENEIISFIGNSDSGKEKIGDLINALVSPTFGTIKILEFTNDGKKIRNINKLRMSIGLLTMNPKDMLFNKTVKKELEFGLKYFKYKMNKKSMRIIDALKLVKLGEEYLDKEIKDLTLTEQKKIALASILIFNPKIIILNEPTIGLGTKDKEDLKNLIKILKEKYKKTIILITKDTDFVYSITERIYVMYKGSIIASGDKDVMTNEKLMTGYGLKQPEIIRFITEAKKKDINLTPTENILDLIKEVYRNAK